MVCWCTVLELGCYAFYSFSYVLIMLLRSLPPLKPFQAGKLLRVTKKGALESPRPTNSCAGSPISSYNAATCTELVYRPPTAAAQALTRLRLQLLLWPWQRFAWGSCLHLKLGGKLLDDIANHVTSGPTLTEVCRALQAAVYDPRVSGVYLHLAPLQAGWAKLQELRRQLLHFSSSGKWAVAYLERGGEKEYYVASACTELYVPPTAALHLRGFSMTGTFLRGVLDNLGVEPQVVRCGKYKAAADQFIATSMGEPQRTQLQALVADVRDAFTREVAASRGKSRGEVAALLDAGVYDMEALAAGGWVTGLAYECEVVARLKARTGGSKQALASVNLQRYAAVAPSAPMLGVARASCKRIGVIRAGGMVLASGSPLIDSMDAGVVIKQLRRARMDSSLAAVVLRVDSPGGDALASDLMWREVQELAAVKPVVASMGDVAASGGYYLAMGGSAIVAEPLSVTGSIGVVAGKMCLERAYSRVGYAKEVVSEGRYAELMSDHRPFHPHEQLLFSQAAEHAYESFRAKAASSRGMSVEAMQEVAQGRVWSGRAALEVGLVDALGGMTRALAMAKQAAGIPAGHDAQVYELSRPFLSRVTQLLHSLRLGGVPKALAAALSGSGAAGGAGGGAVLSALLQAAAGGGDGGLLASAAAALAGSSSSALLQAAALGAAGVEVAALAVGTEAAGRGGGGGGGAGRGVLAVMPPLQL